MGIQSTSRISACVIFFMIFVLLWNIANSLYIGLAIQPSPAFSLLSTLCLFWIIGWWVMEDGKKHEADWIYGWGLFLYVAVWFIVPFYLFKTRSSKAFLTILAFSAIYFGSYILGIIVGVVILFFRNL